MADLTTGLNRKKAAADGLSAEVANAVQTYGGMWAGMRGPDHATTKGYLDAYDDEKGMVFAGGDLDFDILGDTSASPPTANALGIDPAVYKGATVTGVASRADIMKPVYATDSNTLTLTAPTYGTPIGIVVDWATSRTSGPRCAYFMTSGASTPPRGGASSPVNPGGGGRGRLVSMASA